MSCDLRSALPTQDFHRLMPRPPSFTPSLPPQLEQAEVCPVVLHGLVCGHWKLCAATVNSLLPNVAIWHHDLCELSISLWEFIRGV